MQELKFSKRKQAGRSLIEYGDTADKDSEHHLQIKCEEYLQLRNIPSIRIPDVAYRAIFANTGISKNLKEIISSFLKGVPDIVILKPEPDGTNKALCVELKSAMGKASQGQKHFAKKVNVYIIRSFDDFVKLVEEFLK